MSIGLRKRINSPIAVAMACVLSLSLWANVQVAYAAELDTLTPVAKVSGLGAEVAEQHVPFGASEAEIVLPDTLAGTVETTSEIRNEVVNEQPAEPAEPVVSDSTVAGASAVLDVLQNENSTEELVEPQGSENSEETSEPDANESPVMEGTGGLVVPILSETPEEVPVENEVIETAPEAAPEPEATENTETPVAMIIDWVFPAIIANAEEIDNQEPAAEPAAEPADIPAEVPAEPVVPEIPEGNNLPEYTVETVTTTTDITFTGVTWTLDAARSTSTTFDSSIEGARYIYVPSFTTEYQIAGELPVITVIVGTKDLSPAFEQQVVVDGVRITIKADPGVLPEGTAVSARKATVEESAVAQAAVAPERDADKLISSYTFDITLLDSAGNHIQPDTSKGRVKVSFAMEEVKNRAYEADVYHIVNNDAQVPEAEKLDAEKINDTVEADTTGFSFYTVEFTYNELVYVLNGDSCVPLSTIQNTLGIEGNVVAATTSNEGLFYARKLAVDESGMPAVDGEGNYIPDGNGTWYAVAVAPFDTQELLTLTMDDGSVFEIIVTDSGADIKNGGYPYAKRTTTSSVTLSVRLEGTGYSYQWQSCATNSSTDSDWTNIENATNVDLELSNPESGTWYRCDVSGVKSKAVQVRKPNSDGRNWTRTYGGRYYISNGTMAYAIDGSYFDVSGLYVSDGQSYMLGTSYGGCWEILTQGGSYNQIYFYFDDSDAYALYINPVFSETGKGFSFGCDTMLGNYNTSGSYSDSAALEAIKNLNGTLKQVSMIGAASSDSADPSNPAFVIAPVSSAPSSYWLGFYSSRQHWTNSGSRDIVHQTDSGMTMSWTNIQEVTFKFAVGDVASTGALGGSVNYLEDDGYIVGLEEKTNETTPTYTIEILGENDVVVGTLNSVPTDNKGRIPLTGTISDDKITGTVPQKNDTAHTYDLRGQKIRINKTGETEKKELSVKKAGQASPITIPADANVTKPSDVGAGTSSSNVEITTGDTSITVKSNEAGIQFELCDENGTPITTPSDQTGWKSPTNGQYTFTGLTNGGTYTIKTRRVPTASDPGATESEKSTPITVVASPEVTIPTVRVVEYNGTAQAFPVTVSPENTVVTYSTSPDMSYSNTVPTFTNAGRYTIYYKATTGGKTVYGSYTVRIDVQDHDDVVFPEQQPLYLSCYPVENAYANLNAYLGGTISTDRITIIEGTDPYRYPDNVADLCTSKSYENRQLKYSIGQNEVNKTGYLYLLVENPNHTPYVIAIPVVLTNLSRGGDSEPHYPKITPAVEEEVAPTPVPEEPTRTTTRTTPRPEENNDDIGHPNIIDRGNIWGDMSQETKQRLIDKMSETGGEIISTNIEDEEDTDKIPVKEMPIGLIVGEGAVIVSVEGAESSSMGSLGLLDARAVAKSFLTEEQLAKVMSGSILEIKLEVQPLQESSIPAADKSVADEELAARQAENPNLTMGAFIDISMFMRIDDSDWNQITETDPVDIVIDIPDQFKGVGDKYFILRIHNGVPTMFEDTDDDPDTITVSSGLFSTYALVYETPEEESEPELLAAAPTEPSGGHYVPILGGSLALILVFLLIFLKRRQQEN